MNQRTAQLLSMATMVAIMTFFMSLVSTSINFGISEEFLFRFLRAWAIAYALALPLVIFLMPRLQKFFLSRVVVSKQDSASAS